MEKLKPGPLKDLTVLDFTWVLAGPHATKHLADMGANVIKVEPYKVGANERWLPYQVEKNGVCQSSYNINNNRGKKSLCVNLKLPAGRDIINKLIENSDVMIENYAPGVMNRMELDYDSVVKIKPDIIYCSISCFGHWGPYSQNPGYDIISQAASGWTDCTEPPIMAPMAIGDTVSAMHALTAILAALHHKEKSGEGQNIDISMTDCLFSMHENTLPWYLISEAAGNPVQPWQFGGDNPRFALGYAPYGIYKAKDGYINIACITEQRWQSLVDLMGPEYTWLKTDPKMATITSRCSLENTMTIHHALDAWVMAQDSLAEAERKLVGAGVPCMPVRHLVDLATKDPNIKAREMMPTIYQPFLGPMKMYGNPLKFSKTPAGPRSYGPFLGEHNREILANVLHYTDDKIELLYKEEVLYQAPEVDRLPEELKINDK